MERYRVKYECLTAGGGVRIERFGKFVMQRPCSAALWRAEKRALQIDATFSREGNAGWVYHNPLPEQWTASLEGIECLIKPTGFGHVGLFPEHATQWPFLRKHAKGRVLNLFAYSGATTLFLAREGCEVCHVDAAKGMVEWARTNARMNSLDKAPIRWITDDAVKFLHREARRGASYDGVVLDPPSFGRGARGEVFKIERDLDKLLGAVRNVLSPNASFVLLTCHTPGMSPQVLSNILADAFPKTGAVESGEMLIQTLDKPLPAGTFARWTM